MSRTTYSMKRLATIWLTVLAACVDTSSATDPTTGLEADQPLAQTFDVLAEQSALDGDARRSEEFSYAALSVRNGVTPSRLEVRNGAAGEVYEAFVNALDWQTNVSGRPAAFRSLIAWRRTDNGLVRIIAVSLATDSAPLRNPLSLGPGAGPAAVFAIASATYHETTIARPAASAVPETMWIGISGFAKIRELEAGRACVAPSDRPLPKGVQCQQARYSVKFSLMLQPVTVRPFQVPVGTSSRSLTTPSEQVVNGAKFMLNCLRVSSLSGCP